MVSESPEPPAGRLTFYDCGPAAVCAGHCSGFTHRSAPFLTNAQYRCARFSGCLLRPGWRRRRAALSADFRQQAVFTQAQGKSLTHRGSAIGLLATDACAVPLQVMGLNYTPLQRGARSRRVRAAAEISLEPATPAVPAATEKNQHNNEDYKKCRRVHAALLTRLPTEAAPGPL